MTIRLSRPFLGDTDRLLADLRDLLASGYFVQGRQAGAFEEKLARYVGTKHAIAATSGTAALHLALMACGIGDGDEVIVPAYTFPATANVVELVGGRPVFVDVALDSFNIDLDGIESAISPRTRAIMPVHLFGNPCNMDRIREIAASRGLKVIEDAAGALGSSWRGVRCGALGDVGCFSFHPRKLVTTGEGGLLTTDSDQLAERLRTLRNHGLVPTAQGFDLAYAGLNYRMNEFQAIIGSRQVEFLDELVAERLAVAADLRRALDRIRGVVPQAAGSDTIFCPQAFVVRLPGSARDAIEQLKTLGIETNIGTYAVPLLSYYRKKYGCTERQFPHAADLFSRCLALPFYNRMDPSVTPTVIDGLRVVTAEGSRS